MVKPQQHEIMAWAEENGKKRKIRGKNVDKIEKEDVEKKRGLNLTEVVFVFSRTC